MAREIFDEFVDVMALTQINVDDGVRRGIQRRLAEAPSDLFDVAQQSIHKLMKDDPYKRFIVSQLYLDVLDDERASAESKLSRASKWLRTSFHRRKSSRLSAAGLQPVISHVTTPDNDSRRFSMTPSTGRKRTLSVAKMFGRLGGHRSKTKENNAAKIQQQQQH